MLFSIIDRLNGVKEPLAILLTVAAIAFGAGLGIGNYIGLPDRVKALERDMAAIVCLNVASQEGRSGFNCQLLMSEGTRKFIAEIRADEFRLHQELDRRP